MPQPSVYHESHPPSFLLFNIYHSLTRVIRFSHGLKVIRRHLQVWMLAREKVLWKLALQKSELAQEVSLAVVQDVGQAVLGGVVVADVLQLVHPPPAFRHGHIYSGYHVLVQAVMREEVVRCRQAPGIHLCHQARHLFVNGRHKRDPVPGYLFPVIPMSNVGGAHRVVLGPVALGQRGAVGLGPADALPLDVHPGREVPVRLTGRVALLHLGPGGVDGLPARAEQVLGAVVGQQRLEQDHVRVQQGHDRLLEPARVEPV
mmetsp:Transcript_19855/g.28742  ORF Transcript_19855/g.28742 Transcript_19855/m.28742 type:complete len:259 (+) Transcript_19855:107-883(+)|eukprot:CAMPEP_0113950772 /NCGR_PEP_ID=MMETSP1339-20121228/82504_1 /TAXON_ID=94617 /ORGANISM="Fibrocapsa japonica" /LENGTH=258 /DNA_ID=CAMNT_0000958739 /DNA_START=80 /DNA_END=856 /DNA_ORIENTATION=- /assembly_acc=CAM_ASM_000762